jgi:segregation and condensation protein B
MNKVDSEQLPVELIVSAVEALIFASDEPVQPEELSSVLGGIPVEEIEKSIGLLEKRLASNDAGLRVDRIAGGFRLVTRPDLAEWVRQLFRQRNRTRLSPAALETLAIVAYRQPVTAPEIQAIRGKDPSSAVRGLLDKKLLRILGKKKVVGSPLLYGTTKNFLIHFGLDNLKALPSIEDFDQLLLALGTGQAELIEAETTEEGGKLPEDDGQQQEAPLAPEVLVVPQAANNNPPAADE